MCLVNIIYCIGQINLIQIIIHIIQSHANCVLNIGAKKKFEKVKRAELVQHT